MGETEQTANSHQVNFWTKVWDALRVVFKLPF